jgi:hypothetical protein
VLYNDIQKETHFIILKEGVYNLEIVFGSFQQLPKDIKNNVCTICKNLNVLGDT